MVEPGHKLLIYLEGVYPSRYLYYLYNPYILAGIIVVVSAAVYIQVSPNVVQSPKVISLVETFTSTDLV